MTQASERQGPGMAIRQLLIEASVDASELPKHGSLGGLGSQQAGRRLRLSTAGHLLLAGAILAMAFSVVLLSRQAAQNRQRNLGYCNRVPLMLRQPYPQQPQQPGDPLPIATSINLKELVLALPTASPLQKQRLVQQAIELKELYQYHCQSMQIFSANYQALVGMANGAAMLSATMLALLSLRGLQTEIHWPFSVLVASGFALGMAVVTINTFNLKSNQQMSARLYKQTIALSRSFATAIANQEYGSGSDRLSLSDRNELGRFLDFVDKQLALNDTPAFVMDDQFAIKEAAALIHKASTTDSTH
ncbi:MAG: hypothetical protein NTZ40_10315 [Cyanobacteria bacterium]|nr:hypothetical protein [Cyanobacteriota bacterium]